MFDGFRSRSLAGKLVTLVVLAVSLALVTAAERDLHHRADDEVRGSRALWRLLCLNGFGALGYFRWGRRPAAAE